jgi:enoyl-CoA hydratase
MTYECIITAVHGDGPRKTGLITLNRPKALNALNDQLMDELGEALLAFDADDAVGCIVLTGSERAFAAGADIPTMLPHTFATAFKSGLISKFGQPEIKLGIVPGAGGTQRLPRAVGKSKAMDMLLTARMMGAAEAESAGLVSRVVPADKLLDEALAAAETINGFSGPSVALIKELVNLAYQAPLTDGVAVERRYFHALFGSHDQREGMEAFLAKRAPSFEHR